MTIAEWKARTDLPVVVADAQGFIVFVNTAFETVFGWTSAEITGQTLTVILPPSFRDAHNLSFARFYSAEASAVLNHPLQLKAITKDQREFDAEHFIIAEQIEGTWQFAATLRPL